MSDYFGTIIIPKDMYERIRAQVIREIIAYIMGDKDGNTNRQNWRAHVIAAELEKWISTK